VFGAAPAVTADTGLPVGAVGLSFAEHALYQKQELMNAAVNVLLHAPQPCSSRAAVMKVPQQDAVTTQTLKPSLGPHDGWTEREPYDLCESDPT
jgi:hypothetical protein